MLILSRKMGQSLVIGEEVEVTVLEVRGDLVRLGIRAPRTVSIHRKEVYTQIADANRQATEVDAEAVTRAEQFLPSTASSATHPPGPLVAGRRSAA